jgi:mannitol-1-phosphate 5-dehydrogenase
MAEKIVVFGAGATGRGHVGLLAWQAGYEIVFVDINPELVRALGNSGEYRVRLYGRDMHEVPVSGFRIYHAEQREAVAEEIEDAVLVLTAVFDHNLADVAHTVSLAVAACRRAGRTAPLNFIACENMMDSSSALGRHVLTHLSGDDAAYCGEYIGFPDCMISRVVPRPGPDPLVIVAEDYNEWTTRKEAFRGEKPGALTALELVDNQTARLERKLFIHNGGHAVCGYVGFHRGWKYIHEAVKDEVVAEHVLGAMDELGAVIRAKHGFTMESIDEYKKNFVRRGSVAEMRDEILRVVRDPIRKLSPNERLVAPAMLAEQYGLSREWIVKGIAACLRYRHPSDAQSNVMAETIGIEGVISVIENICKISPRTALASDIAAAYHGGPPVPQSGIRG